MAYGFAMIYAAVGDKGEAFRWLERAYNERSVWMAFLKVQPWFDPLRSDPRFEDLLRRMRRFFGLEGSRNSPNVKPTVLAKKAPKVTAVFPRPSTPRWSRSGKVRQ